MNENKPASAEENVSLPSLLFDVAETILISTAAVILLFTFIVRLAVVDGPSMNNTLSHGDVLIVSDVGYTPKGGDIIVLQQMTSAIKTPIVKRVIATENQTIDIDFDTWIVTVDGKVIDESAYRYLAHDQRITSNMRFPLTVPEGYVFVMGDNRNHSSDSRDSRIGLIDERSIFGHVLFRIMPITELGYLGGE